MKKLLAGIFVALSMLAGVAAHAANITTSTAIVFEDNTSDIGAKFGTNTQGKTFANSYTFSSSASFDVSAAVISIALSPKSLDITNLTLTSNGHTVTGVKTTVGDTQYFTINASALTSGNYTLTVYGTVVGKGGSYGGNLSISAVPEASTVAMMLGGLVVVGLGVIRRRRQEAARGNVGNIAFA